VTTNIDPVARQAVADLWPRYERLCRALRLPESTWPAIEPVAGLRDRTGGHDALGEYQPASGSGTFTDPRARLHVDRSTLLDGGGLPVVVHELCHHVCAQRRAGDDPDHGPAFGAAAEPVAAACRKVGITVPAVPWRTPDLAEWPIRPTAVKPKAPKRPKRTPPRPVQGVVELREGGRVDRRQPRPARALVAAGGGGESDEHLLRRLMGDDNWPAGLRRQVLADRRRHGANTRS
jgi:hypothetical protein